MSSFMEYKGFKARVGYSAHDGVFFGRLLEIDDIVTFEGVTVKQIQKGFKDAVDFHIEVCEKIGQKLKKVYSGKVFLRVPPDLHARIAAEADASGKSINEWGKEVLEEATKYQFRKGRKVVHTGITNDLERRESEHRVTYRGGKISQVGRRTTEEAARELEKKKG